MNCACIESVNKRLAPHNHRLQLSHNLTVDDARPVIGLLKIGTASGQPGFHMIPSFCPFCGKKYEKKTPA